MITWTYDIIFKQLYTFKVKSIYLVLERERERERGLYSIEILSQWLERNKKIASKEANLVFPQMSEFIFSGRKRNILARYSLE